MRNRKRERPTLGEQLKEAGSITRALAGSAVFTGYAVGTCAAHTRPVVAAIKQRLHEMAPESLLVACHAYSEGKTLGLRDENFRMMERAAARAAREAINTVKALFRGATA